MNMYINFPYRCIFAISGKDSDQFLQSITTNHVELLTHENSQYSLILSPQGKFLYDVFMIRYNDNIVLDISNSTGLLSHVEKYSINLEIKIKDLSKKYTSCTYTQEFKIAKYINKDGFRFQDPRPRANYMRGILKLDNTEQMRSLDKYNIDRIKRGICDDTDMSNSFPLYYSMQHAINTEKGCYIGQEVTNRMLHKAVLRKKIYIISSQSQLPNPGTIVYCDDAIIGQMCSSASLEGENIGFALLNIASVEGMHNHKIIVGDVQAEFMVSK